jgi:hypothetical protein
MYSNEQVSEGVSVKVEREGKTGWTEINMKRKRKRRSLQPNEDISIGGRLSVIIILLHA